MRTQKRKPSTKAFLTLTIFLFSMSILLTGCPPPQEPPYPGPGVPGLIHDAYHYYDYKDNIGDFVYIHMWNFSWLDDNDTPLDASDDVYGVAAYGLANPENLMGSAGITNALGLIIRPTGGTFTVDSPQWDPAIPGNFYASDTFAPGPGYEMYNPAGYIDVISDSEIHMVGSAHDGVKTISWDLVYTRIPGLGGGWLPWQQWPLPHILDIFPAWMTYYVHMPTALVNGTFTVNDGVNPEDVYTLEDVTGYHDGFYGEAIFSILEWDWLEYKQYNRSGYEDISVQLLHPHGPVYDCEGDWAPCTPGNLRVYHNGTEYNYTRHDDTITLTYLQTEPDPEFGVSYPTQMNIYAVDDAGNVLDLTWTHAQHIRVYYDLPDMFEDNVTYEIIADFTGTFTPAGGTAVTIAGNGFADWGSPPFPESP